jgi:hypothetical protein
MIPALLAQLTPAATPEPLPIRDIAPPVDIPWPPWLIACVVIGGLLALAGIVALIIWWTKKWPTAPPPTPRQLALQSLDALRREVQTLDPYAFSIRVSDVLRSYIGAEYRLHAREQTSPEFLAAISQSPQFYDADRKLLAEFLEHCDLIKFARIDATTADSERLLQSAISFVQGGKA